MPATSRSAELEEIWALFAQEGRENLSAAETSLLTLEQNPGDSATVATLFRAMHSFKGAARMMGLAIMESLAHHAEDLIALARDDGVTLHREMIDLLLAVVDRLRALLDYVLTYGHDVETDQAQDLVETCKQMVERARAKAGKPPTEETVQAATSESINADLPIQQSPGPNPAETIAAPAALPVENDDAFAKFLATAENVLSQLHSALDLLEAGEPESLAQFRPVADDLTSAAANLGYKRVAAVLENLIAETSADISDLGAHVIQIKRLELELFEELTRIQESADEPNQTEENNRTDIVWLFRHWCADQVFANLARLSEIVNEVARRIGEPAVAAIASSEIAMLAEEAAIHLRAIYHGCVFYHLDSAGHLTLALKDIYARIYQGELVANDVLINLTRVYVTKLGGAIDASQEGAEPNLGEFSRLIQEAENVLYVRTKGNETQVSRNVLDVLSLPQEFKQVMTPESVAQFNQVLQAGERFYTVIADLERNQELGAAFLEWSHQQDIHLITNITIYRYRRTLFNFLIATSQTRARLLESLSKLDPDWQYLTLQECSLREQVDSPISCADQFAPASEPIRESNPSPSVPVEILEKLVETCGEMVAYHATLHRVAERLTQIDLVERVLPLAKSASGDGERGRRKLESFLDEWDEDLRALGQVEAEMGSALARLQEAARALRVKPASEILNPLRNQVQEQSRQYGKLVDLDLQGTELDLDYESLQVLADPIRRLVQFAVTDGIEDAEHRQMAGKPATGRVSVRISAREEHVQVVVEDDGRGIDRETLARGLVSDEHGRARIDLAAINADLQTRHGRLSVTSQVGCGTRFDIHLPLDMAVIDGMIVRIGDVRYVVPVSAIRRIVKPDAANLVHTSADGGHGLLRLEGESVQIQTFDGHVHTQDAPNLMVIVDRGQEPIAFGVDELIGRQQVLVRPLRGQFADIQNVSGCALLGEGEVGVVLDLESVGLTHIGEE